MMHELKKELSSSTMKEIKSSGKIRSINIDLLDDGTYAYSVYTEGKGDMGGKSYKYSAGSAGELLKNLKDDLTSPHPRAKKSGLDAELKKY